mmetsp:Transcript_15446/g.27528  ORF Transcript_15446/g.27528 Transcript_15446/m.27528 type:complete len:770 (-) Transcript_15446:1595-3904(-)|eukprot:CAMPEP_0175076634 /NCGR_PEP_ID=MMETSP0052_2-20121109/22847_1 /TAXON_ID=51329 ORGANISM="Polytomella parva, Strain SAG 63-3" /NCGR_SAMPLE_ID=MMETSP0052_2 /ASSEMBLY_ACC=CAM_ASM_000194 /LENGTH=769 /DNA_ID=CAMNT_0016345817 /DNA_START=406 /DNA_END=2715 /DNA_ORIENTATION=-
METLSHAKDKTLANKLLPVSGVDESSIYTNFLNYVDAFPPSTTFNSFPMLGMEGSSSLASQLPIASSSLKASSGQYYDDIFTTNSRQYCELLQEAADISSELFKSPDALEGFYPSEVNRPRFPNNYNSSNPIPALLSDSPSSDCTADSLTSEAASIPKPYFSSSESKNSLAGMDIIPISSHQQSILNMMNCQIRGNIHSNIPHINSDVCNQNTGVFLDSDAASDIHTNSGVLPSSELYNNNVSTSSNEKSNNSNSNNSSSSTAADSSSRENDNKAISAAKVPRKRTSRQLKEPSAATSSRSRSATSGSRRSSKSSLQKVREPSLARPPPSVLSIEGEVSGSNLSSSENRPLLGLSSPQTNASSYSPDLNANKMVSNVKGNGNSSSLPGAYNGTNTPANFPSNHMKEASPNFPIPSVPASSAAATTTAATTAAVVPPNTSTTEPASSAYSGPAPSIEKIRQVEEELRQKMEKVQLLENENAELRFQHSLFEHMVGFHSFFLNFLTQRKGIHSKEPVAESFPPLEHFTCHPKSDGTGLQTRMGQLIEPQVFIRTLLKEDSDSDLSSATFVRLYKHYVAELSVCIIALESNEEDKEAIDRLISICNRSSSLCRRMRVKAPATYEKITLMHLETLETDQIAPPEHWKSVAIALDFSEEQGPQIIRLYQVFKKIMVNVLSARKLLQDELDRDLQRTLESRGLLDPNCLHADSATFTRFNKSFAKEKCAHDLVKVSVYGRTLTVFQYAKVVVHSYPFFPDPTAIVCAYADLHGQK